jgi:hypothetical protein
MARRNRKDRDQELKELQTHVQAEIQELRRLYHAHAHDLISNPDAPLLPELYHYTSIEGLQGILERRCLWSTHFEYLNDSTEVIYGQKVNDGVIQGRINKCSELTQVFLHQMFDMHHMIYQGIAIYLSCFCEDGDLLSQWRSYGSGGGGCAIGFKPRLVNENGRSRLPSPQELGFGIAKVIYEEEEQRQLAHGLVDRVFKGIEKHLEAAREDLLDADKLILFMRCTHLR